MKKPTGIQALYVISLFVLVGASAHAELKALKQQAIVEDEIIPEGADAQEEKVAVAEKPAAKTVVKRSATVKEETEITPAFKEEAEVAPPLKEETQTVAMAPAAPLVAEKPSTGAQLDQGIKSKMGEVQTQFEAAMLKTLDRIKITVDDGAPAQGASAPTQSVEVKDSLVATQAAPDKNSYLQVEAAPAIAADKEDGAGTDADAASLGAAEKPKSERKVRVAPVFGKSSINSSNYNVSSHYTAGIELEMDVDTNFALVLGYAYSQYDIGLSNGNPFNSYYQPYGYNNANTTSLQYNQNVFTGGVRLYLMPKESKFRVYGGVGLGYNIGYLNYAQNNSTAYMYNQYNPYYNTPDYEVKSWLGLLETGGSFSVSDNVSIGALFKYALVFSSSQNAPLNNYAFTNNFNYGQTTDKAVIGGSLAQDSFYSILGTVKVAF